MKSDEEILKKRLRDAREIKAHIENKDKGVDQLDAPTLVTMGVDPQIASLVRGSRLDDIEKYIERLEKDLECCRRNSDSEGLEGVWQSDEE